MPESSGSYLMDARDQIPGKQSRAGETQAKRHSMLLDTHWKKTQEPAGTAENLELGLGLGIRPDGDPGATLLISSLECFLLPLIHQVGSVPQEDHLAWVLPKFALSGLVRA